MTPSSIVNALSQVRGAYSLAFLTEDKLIAARDPHGFRPLVLGRVGDGWVVASETCAFDLIGARYEREIEPGEILMIDARGVQSIKPFAPAPRHHCVFEYIYFARPDSQVFGRNVYAVRKELGRQLARESGIPADIVIPVPDSGVPAAIGYAEEAGLPFEMGLIRNHYVGRTFIEPRTRSGIRRQGEAGTPSRGAGREAHRRRRRLIVRVRARSSWRCSTGGRARCTCASARRRRRTPLLRDRHADEEELIASRSRRGIREYLARLALVSEHPGMYVRERERRVLRRVLHRQLPGRAGDDPKVRQLHLFEARSRPDEQRWLRLDQFGAAAVFSAHERVVCPFGVGVGGSTV